MDPGPGVWQGGATGCRLLTSPQGLRSGQAGSLQYPFRGSGRPMEVMERGPHAAATAGTALASG